MRVSKNKVTLLSMVVAGFFAVDAQAFTFNQSDQPHLLATSTQTATASLASSIPVSPNSVGVMDVIPNDHQDGQRDAMQKFFAVLSITQKSRTANAFTEHAQDPWLVQSDQARQYAINIDHRKNYAGYDRNKSAETMA